MTTLYFGLSSTRCQACTSRRQPNSGATDTYLDQQVMSNNKKFLYFAVGLSVLWMAAMILLARASADILGAPGDGDNISLAGSPPPSSNG
jgi:hypothetical protein